MIKAVELFNKINPLIWQKIYASQVKDLDKVPRGKLTNYLESRLAVYLNELKKAKDDFAGNSILRKIDFIYRAAAVSEEYDNSNSIGSGYLISMSLELFKKTQFSRLRTTLIEFMSSMKSVNREMAETFEMALFETLLDSNDDLQTSYAAIDYIASKNTQRLLESARYFIDKMSLTERFISKKIVSCLLSLYDEDKKSSSIVKEYLDKFYSDSIVMSAFAENLHLLSREKHVVYFYRKVLETGDTALMCLAFESLLNAYNYNKTLPEKGMMLHEEISLALTEHDEKFVLFALNRVCGFAEDKLPQELLGILIDKLRILQSETASEKVRLSAVLAYEKLRVFSDSKSYKLYKEIKKILSGRDRSRHIKIPEKVLSGYDDDSIGRVLGVLSQNDFSIQFKRGLFKRVFLIKDAFFKFRLWRFFYEITRPSVSKRKNISHTTGRRFVSDFRSASPILSDDSEGAVPGEPMKIGERKEISPSIPLPDDFISALENNKKEYKIFSAEGITLIMPPKGIFNKICADFKIAASFSAICEKRKTSIAEYLGAFRKMGFEVCITPYSDKKPNADKHSKFGLYAILPAIPFLNSSFREELKNYLFSLQTNTIAQLYVFIGIFILFFIARLIFLNLQFRRIRKSFPLCIGGWGTRGKSSLERLKCALFETMGCAYFSKTTGSEASFVYSLKDGVSGVVPIFRPFGKTTIWEQLTFAGLAAKMRVELFLWECMAVTPAYVRTMQKTWMRDDIATITNTYPDHEDHQGPAPWNVADAMAEFVPYKGTLITAEKEMYPFLENRSIKNKSYFERVDEADIYALHNEILELLPYREHPANIALLLRLARFLGINQDIAIHGIIKRVKPDIGVLKIYPPLNVNNREISFISGFSANEKTACLHNWREAKMSKTDNAGKNTVTAVLINNRKDRPARSLIFAELAVRDIDPDYYFVAGEGQAAFINSVRTLSMGYMSQEQAEAFIKKFIIIESKISPPEAVFGLIASYVPEGALCKVMGIQNIKGIGLDIYDYLENKKTVMKIPAGGNVLTQMISAFFTPVRMIVNRRKADYIYSLLSRNKISANDASSIISSLMR